MPQTKMLETSDIDALCALMVGDEISEHWGRRDFELAIDNKTRICIFLEGVGFILLQLVADEAEVLMIWIAQNMRQKGYATKIMNSAIEYLVKSYIVDIYLEVATDNIAAIQLYNLFEFIEIGCRKDYYKGKNGANIDAIVMKRHIAA